MHRARAAFSREQKIDFSVKQENPDKKRTGFRRKGRNWLLFGNRWYPRKYDGIKMVCFIILMVFLGGCAAEGSSEQEKNVSGSWAETDSGDYSQETQPLENETEEPGNVCLSIEDYLKNSTEIQKAYSGILLHPERNQEFFAVTNQIPSDNQWKLDLADGTEPYCFAVEDVNQDGVEELLLGYGFQYGVPQILLNILQYDQDQSRVTDLDGERTYPLMDSLVFYTEGYFSTQNGTSDLYTECWRIEDKPEHYWYGWERASEFQDTDGKKIGLEDYYVMVGESTIEVEWTEVTEENIRKRIFLKNGNSTFQEQKNKPI